MRFFASSRISWLKVRSVPSISTDSGMMFSRLPPLMAPMVTTAGAVVMLSWRLTTVCRPLMICAEAEIGSTPDQGCEPCVCLPVTLTLKPSAPAIIEPTR